MNNNVYNKNTFTALPFQYPEGTDWTYRRENQENSYTDPSMNSQQLSGASSPPLRTKHIPFVK